MSASASVVFRMSVIPEPSVFSATSFSRFSGTSFILGKKNPTIPDYSFQVSRVCVKVEFSFVFYVLSTMLQSFGTFSAFSVAARLFCDKDKCKISL